MRQPLKTPVMPTLTEGRQKNATMSTDEKRERILVVAEQLFAAQGYAKTTLDQIVGELGVTKPFVYYYFHNKLEIFETLSWRPTAACFSAMDFPKEDVRAAHVKVAEGIEQLIRATLKHYPASFFPYREPQVYRPEYLAAYKQLANHFYARMCKLLEQGRADGMLHFHDTKITALAACSLPGFIYSWYRPDGRLSPEQLAQELTQLCRRLIGLQLSE